MKYKLKLGKSNSKNINIQRNANFFLIAILTVLVTQKTSAYGSTAHRIYTDLRFALGSNAANCTKYKTAWK